jgi:hypothetical protein
VLLICPVRPGDTNEELRYALRSWETNLILPDLQLLTVGYKPSWLEPDWHYAGNDFKSMPHAVYANIRQGAARAVDLGFEEVVYMNDDFFCMDPVGCILPVRRNCTLAEHIAQFPPNGGHWWATSLRLTASWLAEQGFPHPDSYEVHRPLLASAEGMLESLSRWDLATGDAVPQWRTMYGVLQKVLAYPVQDAKLGLRQPGFGTPWVSTSDQSWRRYASQVKPRFQKPSRWERS